MPGAGPSGSGMMEPEQLRRIMRATQLIARTDTEFSLTLRPEEATLAGAESSRLALPLSGEERTIREEKANTGESVEYFAAAEWTEDGLVIERKVDGGGKVKDRVHVDEKGRLVLEREIDALRGGKVEGTLVYQRKEG